MMKMKRRIEDNDGEGGDEKDGEDEGDGNEDAGEEDIEGNVKCDQCREQPFIYFCGRERPCSNCVQKGFACTDSRQQDWNFRNPPERQDEDQDQEDDGEDDKMEGIEEDEDGLFVPETPARSAGGSGRLNSHQREALRRFHDQLDKSGYRMVQTLTRSRSPQTPVYQNPDPFVSAYQTVPKQRRPRGESVSSGTALAPFIYQRGAAAGDADHPYGGGPRPSISRPRQEMENEQGSWHENLTRPSQDFGNRNTGMMGSGMQERENSSFEQQARNNFSHSIDEDFLHQLLQVPHTPSHNQNPLSEVMALPQGASNENLSAEYVFIRDWFNTRGIDNSQLCDEMTDFFTSPFSINLCAKGPTKACDALTHRDQFSAMWEGGECFTCNDCHLLQNQHKTPDQSQAIEFSKAHLCQGCTNRVRNQGIGKNGACLCTATMRKSWFCHKHRVAIIDKVKGNAARYDEWSIRAGAGCGGCYARGVELNWEMWRCKVCGEFVEMYDLQRALALPF